MGVSREPNQELLFACATLDSSQLKVADIQELLDSISDWSLFFQQLEFDGLAPIFYRHCQNMSLQIAKEQMMTLKSLVVRHKAIAKARYIALQEFSVAMSEKGIDWYALKGLALAEVLYEDESLRPMRDFDILVPKARLKEVGELMIRLGYDLPENQPSRFMRDSHQLPNAEKKVNGFTISIEVHHNAIGRDAITGSMEFKDVVKPETFNWHDIEIKTLSKIDTLHQVARHLEATHPEGKLKLINVLDVTAFADKYYADLDWKEVEKRYPHILNTLGCLHMIHPLPNKLQNLLEEKKYLPVNRTINGIAEIMQPINSVLRSKQNIRSKLSQLFFPPDWWLHLYYSVAPNKSLLNAKTIRHPYNLFKSAIKRAYSFAMGG